MNQSLAIKSEDSEAITCLRGWLSPGDTIYTILRRCSRSGMSRDIGVVLIKPGDSDGPKILHPNYAVAEVLGVKRTKAGDGISLSGCGMDMGFHIAYELGRVLFPLGFGYMPEKNKMQHANLRPASRAQAAGLRNKGFTFHGRNGDTSGWDDDGGYAFKHVWL